MWKAHDALRADLADLLKALAAMETAQTNPESTRGSRVRAAARGRASAELRGAPGLPTTSRLRCAVRRCGRSRHKSAPPLTPRNRTRRLTRSALSRRSCGC
jgi:hypothetical protein